MAAVAIGSNGEACKNTAIDGTAKPASMRVQECTNLRAVLTRLGAFSLGSNRARFVSASNAFVRDADGATLDLPIDGGDAVARVQLTRRVGVQSGVSLLRR